MGETFEVSPPMPNPQTTTKSLKSTGCRLTPWRAVGFGALVVAIATGVGVLVYFAGGPRGTFTCNCHQLTDQSTSQFWSSCLAAVQDRKMCLSSKCYTEDSANVTTPTTTPSATELSGDFRLPSTMYPVHYHLELQPNIYSGDSKDFTFDGHVDISINCTAETFNITLHINDLTIINQSISLLKTSPAAESVSVSHYTVDLARQFIVFHLEESLKPGSTYNLSMDFSGPMKTDLKGLYLSSYQREETTVYMAVSMLAPTDARKVFPCFDEPALKATFDVVLVRQAHLVSLSNMPIIRNEPRPDGLVADIFNTTERMSTYLLAFVVCDFKYKEDRTLTGTEVRVWSRPESVNQTELALHVAVKILEFYEDYFQIKYPLPKQDMIAIPDFLIGGMENWGLITYRESYLLYDPSTSSASNKQHTVAIIAHELAHQWFGNLVTPSWWDDIWLNEGFASFVEYLGGEAAFPSWHWLEQFVLSDLNRAFLQDGLVTSHPIYQSVNHPDEINEIFDSITYAKGASVIRMLRYVVGEDVFRQGLTKYLRSLAYKSAYHDQLYSALTEECLAVGVSMDVKAFMDTWTLQMNFPVVTVRQIADNLIELQQQRFLVGDNGTSDKGTSPFQYLWEIPFTYTTSNELDFQHHRIEFMPKTGETVTIVDSNLPLKTSKDGWLIGNIQQYGYYRVTYDADNWLAIIQQLQNNHTAIHVINRAQLINDAWSLARASMLDQMTALHLLEYLQHEEDYVPWMVASIELSTLDEMLAQTGSYANFRKFMVRAVNPLYQKLSVNNTESSHLKSQLRTAIVDLACKYDIIECVSEARDLFKRWMISPDNNPITSWQSLSVYCTAIRHGNTADWDFAYQAYKNSNVATEKQTLLSALSCSKDAWVLQRYLERSLDDGEIRSQDTVSSMINVASNPVGRYLAWSFFQRHWQELRRRYGSGLFSFANLIRGITNSFNTQLALEQLKEFITTHPDRGTGSRAFQQAIERTRSNIDWLVKNEQVVSTWLINYLSS